LAIDVVTFKYCRFLKFYPLALYFSDSFLNFELIAAIGECNQSLSLAIIFNKRIIWITIQWCIERG
jgi:hypothetical protein